MFTVTLYTHHLRLRVHHRQMVVVQIDDDYNKHIGKLYCLTNRSMVSKHNFHQLFPCIYNKYYILAIKRQLQY